MTKVTSVIAFPIAAVTMVIVPSRWLARFVRKINMPESLSALQRIESVGVDINSWRPPIFNKPEYQRISDKSAMDGIALRMSGQQWDSDTGGVIAEIVRLTGRVVDDYDDGYDAEELCMCGKERGVHQAKTDACPNKDTGFSWLVSFTPKPKVN